MNGNGDERAVSEHIGTVDKRFCTVHIIYAGNFNLKLIKFFWWSWEHLKNSSEQSFIKPYLKIVQMISDSFWDIILISATDVSLSTTPEHGIYGLST